MGASLLAVAKSIYYDEDKLLFVTSIEKIHTIMVGTTSDKQISRTFQGFAQDKLQSSRTNIYSMNRHPLTAPF